ncbi:MAG: JAB domain-containing protein [Bacteroidetes bacterium]|nr:JAB domain-containing protein [Bacteroidota bacterium]
MTALKSLFNVAEIELTYKSKVKPADRPKVNSVASAYDLLMSVWDMNKIELVEQFYILLLDRGSTCLGVSEISRGGVSACFVDTKILFGTAIKAKASGIILAHNHPSGNLKPSRLDEALTLKIIEGGKLLDIDVQDHLIVTPQSYYSFAEYGLM